MSHLSETTVRLDSKEGLKKACEFIPELHFHERTSFFAYTDRECDFCISIDGAKYELGFKRMLDGTLKPLVDWYFPGGLEKALGGKDMPVITQAHTVGKLAVEAVKAGQTAVTVTRNSNGEMSLFAGKLKPFEKWKPFAKNDLIKKLNAKAQEKGQILTTIS